MQTRHITANDIDWPQSLVDVSDCLNRGGLVALPTETVYGLGANALDEKAVASIFEAKGRPSDNPLIVHIADLSALSLLVRDIPPVADKLMQAFWPGALTLVMKKASGVPDIVTAGLETVAIRMPIHPVALEIIRRSGVPIAAPSANRSGKPSPTDAQHVAFDMDGRIDIIVDGGPCSVGLESTVLDVTVMPPMILRPGGITKEIIEAVIGPISVDPALDEKTKITPKSPGMKYRHYAPKAQMTVFFGLQHDMTNAVLQAAATDKHTKRIAILCTDETQQFYADDVYQVISMGSRCRLDNIAQNIFSALRMCDDAGAEIILCEGFDEVGLGHAIMNRLGKAASGHIVYVTAKNKGDL